mgnify:CR=1 FL=1
MLANAKKIVPAVHQRTKPATNAKRAVVRMAAARISAEIAKTMIAKIANANPPVLAAPANLKKSQSATVRQDVVLMAAAESKSKLPAKITVPAA